MFNYNDNITQVVNVYVNAPYGFPNRREHLLITQATKLISY